MGARQGKNKFRCSLLNNKTQRGKDAEKKKKAETQRFSQKKSPPLEGFSFQQLL
jgi:hypothetical protein